MSYSDIIRDNCENHSSVPWWPKFAFHYTDVTNAVNILSTGYLFSRASASYRGVMQNDNASRQVIDMTNTGVTSMVRFYFRPLTPTQYYNEGYKHPALRYDHDENANVPVPIFLLFDLEKLLSVPGVCFSERSQAGHGTSLISGEEAFRSLNFDYIYDNSYEKLSETKQYRHAEIVHPNALEISSCIRNILCRNNMERTTLLNLLKEKDQKAFIRYKDIIKVYKEDTFECNGLYISSCMYLNNTISISFADTYSGKRYIERMMEKLSVTHLAPIKVRISLKWFNSRNTLKQEYIETEIDAYETNQIKIKNLPAIAGAKNIGIEIYLDGKLVCYNVQSLDSSEVWG